MMKRTLKAEERHVWAMVAATVLPRPGRSAPPPLVAEAPPSLAAIERPAPAPAPCPAAAKPTPPAFPTLGAIEPGRRRRIVRGRGGVGARLDLHGMTQDQARTAVADFLRRAQADGLRAALVITGKGVSGDGVLRRRVPEWLAEPALRGLVAGVSSADRRHGGDGAFYVALKRPAAPG